MESPGFAWLSAKEEDDKSEGLGYEEEEDGKSEGLGYEDKEDGESGDLGSAGLFAEGLPFGIMNETIQRAAGSQSDAVSEYVMIIQRLQYIKPEDLKKNGWREVTPDIMRERTSSREYVFTAREELRIRYDEREEGKEEVGPHYHVYNPNTSNTKNRYLDINGNVVKKGSKASHIMIKEEGEK